MSQEMCEGDDVSFGEKLLGMQGFSALRAQRYRAELGKLLIHRMTTTQRWAIGIAGINLFVAFEIVAMTFAMKWDRPSLVTSAQARWTFAIFFMALGLLLGAWFLRIAVQGGFSRRLGDMMAVAIVLVFGGAAASLFYNSASIVDDAGTREQMLFGAGVVVACTIGCIVLAAIQATHRRTHEKLLRIEYHLAELMERHPGATS